jgi:hypothetical protein
VDVDFKKWARSRDLDETVGHAPKRKVPTLRFPKLPKGHKPVELKTDDGATLEDGYGVPLLLSFTKVFEPIPEIEVWHFTICGNR